MLSYSHISVSNAEPSTDAKSCTPCHQKISESWQKSAHANSSTQLALHERNTPRCRSCHDDAGLRALIHDQLTLKNEGAKTKRHSLSSKGVDCQSCHGIMISEKHDTLVERERLKDIARRSCQRCHELPPLPQRKLNCFDPHRLSLIKESRCSTENFKDQRLKTDTAHDTKSHLHRRD